MKSDNKAPQEETRRNSRKVTVKKSPAGKGHLFKRWENPSENRMGNDISAEVKIANSNGDLEGGKDKRWHMNEGE